MTYYTTGQALSLGWNNCCGPVAITNIILSYRNKNSNISVPNNNKLFLDIANYGVNNGYYSTKDGTYISSSPSYLLGAIRIHADGNVRGKFSIIYENISYYLDKGYLLYLNLYGHSTYGNHSVVCFAYTRLFSSNSKKYMTYMKVADGWDTSARYINLETVNYAKYDTNNFSIADVWGK